MGEIIVNFADGADLPVTTTLGVREGEGVTLTCNVIRGNPAIYNFTWTRSTNASMTLGENNTISFTDFDILDSDTYICMVSNEAGVGTVNVTIIIGSKLFGHNEIFSECGFISAPPNITSPPMDQLVVTPDNVTLRCLATGYPRPTIRWGVTNEDYTRTTYLDTNAENQNFIVGYLTADDFDIEVIEILGDREVMSTLTFNITQPGFAGIYSCNVVNEIGTDNAYATLTIHSESRMFHMQVLY